MTTTGRFYMLGSLTAAALVLATASCGGKTNDPSTSDGGGASDAGSDAAADATGDSTGDTTPTPDACPATLPTDGAACSPNGLVCGYGDDPRPGCHPSATCIGGKWSIPPSACPPLPPTTCPPTREEAAGKTCSPKDAWCGYGGLSCECTNCTKYPVVSCSGPLIWHCASPNPDTKCPAGIPNLGTACTVEAYQCVYGCEPNMARTCTAGHWVASTGPGGCPVSSRRFKRDIEYLGATDLQRLTQQLLSLKLTTYDYKDPALAGRRHLGFIIEDGPRTFAIDTQGDRVDLYGYTSMAVAAVQVQSKELAALQAEVKALKEQVAAMQQAQAACTKK